MEGQRTHNRFAAPPRGTRVRILGIIYVLYIRNYTVMKMSEYYREQTTVVTVGLAYDKGHKNYE